MSYDNLIRKVRSPKIILPGYKYEGPGNALDIGEPVNKADAVAQQHDYSYDYATNADDIREADNNAIDSFVSLDTLKDSPLGGVVGAAGLEAKKVVENIIGPQYPNSSTLKNNARRLLYRKALMAYSVKRKRYA